MYAMFFGPPRHVRQTCRGDGDGLLRQDEIHDREIVDGQIPEHVDILLKQPEVDADGIVVVEVSQLAAADQLADLLHGAGINKGVVNHQHELAAGRLVDQPAGLVARRGDRLFHQYVLAGAEGGAGELEMQGDRRGDRHGVDGRISDQIQRIGRDANARIAAFRLRQPLGAAVRHHRDAGVRELREIANQVGAPVPVADDADTNHVCVTSRPVLACRRRRVAPSQVVSVSRLTPDPA